MALFKRKSNPKKAVRITFAAEVIGCSSEAIRLGMVGNFQTFKLNPDKKTSPILMYEAELNQYLEQRDKDLIVN